MSALVKEAWLLERYGPRLTMLQLAEVLQLSRSHINNCVSDGTLRLRTYLDGRNRFADSRDVAEHLENLRETAT